ncbi:hypothetical protein ASPCAL09004 [Aspergillus calidoustus]|uniref:Uncharacterized protein n=1 Tax=Aspergillus calidoustus TaxID=454130 RepID=A0A0U5GVD7_ASPCI|nr:hypothetical protein ASPCAL09004 [Aspergillus calidoustus]
MRPNQSSTPSLPLLHTSFQPRHKTTITDSEHDNESARPYSTFTSDYLSTAPASPLSSASTLTLPSSPTSPSTSPSIFQFQHIRTPRPMHDSTKTALSNTHTQAHHTHHAHSSGGIQIPLRRRPSNIDTILRQERTRCDVDVVERQGLSLLEPRPVDLEPISGASMGFGIDTRIQQLYMQPVAHAQIPTMTSDESSGFRENRLSSGSADSTSIRSRRLSQPRFVLGGIFEVMEGRG